MKILFFGTDNFALEVLTTLSKHHEIVGVVTTPDSPVGRKQTIQESPVSVLAGELQLKIFKPASLKNNTEFEMTLRGLNPELFVVVVYGKIIPESVLSIPPHGTINVHPSLLPKYRGPSPIRTPLYNGDTVTGVSIMLLDAQVDHGPLLAARELLIEPDDNNITLTEKLAASAGPLLLEAIDQYVTKQIVPQPQNDAQATFTKIVSKQDGHIDWNRTAREINNQFRAFYDWPGIWTTWQGQVLKILDCGVVDATCTQAPGTVLLGGQVACGNGTVLQILQLQLAGKNATDIKSFLNGYKEFVGSKVE